MYHKDVEVANYSHPGMHMLRDDMCGVQVEDIHPRHCVTNYSGRFFLREN